MAGIIATESKYLTFERDKLIKFMQHFTNISLLNVFGDPLRNYVFSFNLNSYVPAEEGIKVGKPHTILIYLPPGYPEEASPQVTALTPLFHPEVNPANGNIDVSARWTGSDSPSLAKLVNLLAMMITGKIYKTAVPANPEALAWYEEHAGELPLDQPVRAELRVDADVSEEEAQIQLIRQLLQRNQLFIAAREMAGLPPTLDFPERDEVMTRIKDAMNDTKRLSNGIKDLAEIRELISQNRIYALAGRMARLPPLWFPERADIMEGIEQAKQICSRFFALAQNYEKRKAYGKALSCGLTILQHIPDHPEAQDLVRRMQQFTTEPESLAGEVDAEGNPLSVRLKHDEEDTPAHSFGEGFPVKRALGIGAAVLAAILVIVGGAMFIKERGTQRSVEASIASAKSMMEGLQYAAAKETLERARASASAQNLLASSGAALIIEIENILNADEFREGLLQEQLSAELIKEGPKHIAEYYPGNQASGLSALNASFIRQDGSRRVFELGCVGRNYEGKNARLTLVLAHDERTGRWEVLDE